MRLYIVEKRGRWLFLNGPFEYPVWVDQPHLATPLSRGKAEQYTHLLDADAVTAVG